MFDFNFVVKILISASLGYLVLNTILKYHTYNDLPTALMALVLLIILTFYSDIDYNTLFTILIVSTIVLTIVVKLLLLSKNKYYYLLLNINKRDYERVKNIFTDNTKIKITYFKKYPYLIKFNEKKQKKIKKALKTFDSIESKSPKRFNICHYWTLIIYIIMMVILWRF